MANKPVKSTLSAMSELALLLPEGSQTVGHAPPQSSRNEAWDLAPWIES
jgi:hypothetical protein